MGGVDTFIVGNLGGWNGEGGGGRGGGEVIDVTDRSGVPLSSETWIFFAPNLEHLKNVRVKGSFVVPNIFIFFCCCRK